MVALMFAMMSPADPMGADGAFNGLCQHVGTGMGHGQLRRQLDDDQPR